jgi:hypothetical protein
MPDDADPRVLAAQQRAAECASVAAEHRSALSVALADLRSGACDPVLVARVEAALLQHHLAQEAAASARLGAVQLAAEVEHAALFEKLCEGQLLATRRDDARFESLLSLADFCEQLRVRAEQCTCPAARAVPLRSHWLTSKDAV